MTLDFLQTIDGNRVIEDPIIAPSTVAVRLHVSMNILNDEGGTATFIGDKEKDIHPSLMVTGLDGVFSNFSPLDPTSNAMVVDVYAEKIELSLECHQVNILVSYSSLCILCSECLHLFVALTNLVQTGLSR